jgi:WD40 repeat protein
VVWDRLTGHELWALTVPPNPGGGFGLLPLNRLAFTPDSRRLVAAGAAGVRVYDLANGKLLHTFPADPLNGADISISADGQVLAVTEKHGQDYPRSYKVRVWSLTTWAEDEALTKRLANYAFALFSPDGRTLAAFTPGNDQIERQVDFLDVRGEKKLGQAAPLGAALSYLFSPDGGRFAISNRSGLKVWSVPDGLLVGELSEERGPGALGEVNFLDDDRVITGGCDGTVRLWQLSTKNEIWRITPLGRNMCIPCALSPDHKVLTTGNMLLRHFELSTREDRLPTVSAGGPVAFSPSGKLLAYAPLAIPARETAIALTDWKSGRAQALTGHAAAIVGLGFVGDDAQLVSSGEEPSVRVWDRQTGKELWKRDVGIDNPHIAVSPKWGVAIPAQDRTVALVATGNGAVQGTFGSYTGKMPPIHYCALAFSGDGKSLAGAFYQQGPGRVGAMIKPRVLVWDLTGKGGVIADLEHDKLSLPQQGIRLLSVSEDGKRVAAVDPGGQRSCFVWDLTNGKERTLAESASGFSAIAFAPDGKTLALGEADGGVIVWDVATEKLVRKYEGHHAAATHLAWTPDGKVLASSSADGSVLLWDTTGKAPAPAKPVPLTDEQRRKLLDQAWDDLASKSAQTGYQAMLVFAAHPKDGLALLKERLKPGKAADTLRVSRAVEFLEYNGTPDAVAILRAFMKAAADGPEKADAAGALARLEKRPRP